MLRRSISIDSLKSIQVLRLRHSVPCLSATNYSIPTACIKNIQQRNYSGTACIKNIQQRNYFGRSVNHLSCPIYSRPCVLSAVPYLARLNSTVSSNAVDSGGTLDLPLGYIPQPPAIPENFTDSTMAENVLNALGEPTLTSLGLCNSTPAGFMQMGLETLHVTCNLPWWGSIIAGTVILRMCVFPLVILAQRNIAHMNNHMPTIQALQERFQEQKMKGNLLETARVGNELQSYMARNKVRPFRSMLVPFAQLPIFLSVFVGLRAMANLPVESMQSGGLLWFSDLTIPDPFYILPLLSMGTLLTTIELGVDGPGAANMSHTIKWVMRAMPVLVLPFVINFPSALLCYWLTSNIFSLFQMLMLKIPKVRAFLNIPAIVKHQKPKSEKKGFVDGFRDTFSNSKLMAEMENRQRAQYDRYKEAGVKPPVKTYAYDPTKPKTALKAKS